MPKGTGPSHGDSTASHLIKLGKTAEHLMSAALAESTKQAYRQAWQKFHQFLGSHSMNFNFPVTTQTLTYFVAYLYEMKYAATTITSTISAISFAHNLASMPDPASSFIIRKLLQGARKLGDNQDSRLPITMAMLHNVIQASEILISNLFHRCCFQAMCALAFHALLRVGEMTSSPNNLHLRHIHIMASSLHINFEKFKHSKGKTSQHNIQAESGSLACPVTCLRRYLLVRGQKEGPLFLRVDGTAVTRREFQADLRRHLAHWGYPVQRYNTHSFRIGAATHMAQKGASDAQIRQAGRWASNAFTAYTRVHAM